MVALLFTEEDPICDYFVVTSLSSIRRTAAEFSPSYSGFRRLTFDACALGVQSRCQTAGAASAAVGLGAGCQMDGSDMAAVWSAT